MTYAMSREELISEMEKYMAQVTLKEFSDEDVERIGLLAEECYIQRNEFDLIDKGYEPDTVVRDVKTCNPALRLMMTMLQYARHPDYAGANQPGIFAFNNILKTKSLREHLVNIYRDRDVVPQEQK
jgi:hypothetical protein